MSRAKPKIEYAPWTPRARAPWVQRLDVWSCLCGHRQEGDKSPCQMCGDQMQLVRAAGTAS